ncbi:sulfurtransferase TusA family protein [Paenactinomyces guangxiensis]|uniref:Sulfurtransferase TusA family protein n=1 Tax=Paenactinomyces guangxiensis TaxID=1490290 RepID=A0A7W1WU31_9BACL|nr:sulfurtransferase TusA family protein [Paenactinomyces guangxiensis]MBA4496071.1 sulfurtransferase TusA family protein [Paenactinomyces guangxiensis]MBH8593159.1 sulfurtransferase TusA family protein [Paenactinomyces guangxiensis]
MNAAKVIDAKGLSCPMPVVRTKKAMDELKAGQILELHTTDSGALSDIPAWAKTAGHQVIEQSEDNGVYKFWIQKG